MLIKYKTEPTIIVLSPNSANLIKILTQFIYSINIRYFSPSSLPCPVTLQGITYKIGAEAKGKYISSSAVSRSNIEGENVLYCYIENTSDCKERHVSHSSPVFCTAKYRGGVRRTEGLIKQRGLKNSNSNKIKSQPLPLCFR